MTDPSSIEKPNEGKGAGWSVIFIILIALVLIGGIAKTLQITARWVSNLGHTEFAIEPQFDDAYEFSQGLAAVRVGDSAIGKWGFIAKTGKFVINPQFSATDRFAEGLAPVSIGNPEKWGYIDTSGQLVIAPRFDSARLFSGGYAPVRVGDKQTGKWGYIDRQARFVIAPQFTWATPFVDGLAAVCVASKCGFINSNGAFAVQPQFDWASSFSEGLASVRIDDYSKLSLLGHSKLVVESRYWYLDKTTLHLTIHVHADSAQDFQSGLAAAEGGNESPRKFGYISKNGDFAIAPQFDYAAAFGEGGLAPVGIGRGHDVKCGFIDRSGSFVIQPKFAWARPFSEGLAAVQYGDYDTGKWGYIARSGSL